MNGNSGNEGLYTAANQVQQQHLLEMIGRKSGIYQICDCINRAKLDGDDLEHVRQDARELAELAVFWNVRVDARIAATMQAILGTGSPGARAAMTSWRKAASAAAGRRGRSLELIVNHFGGWLQEALEHVREAWLEALPHLVPCVSQLGDRGMREIVCAANELRSAEDCGVLLSFMSEYGATTGAILVALCEIGCWWVTHGQKGQLERLAALLPPRRAMESCDSQALIPALAELKRVVCENVPVAWPSVFELIALLASASPSSACVAATRLPRKWTLLPERAVLPYLEDFTELVRAIGIRAVGFGLGTLPRLYCKYGVERTRRFVRHGVAVAEACGVTAAEWFLEQKTVAARKSLFKDQNVAGSAGRKE